MFADILTKKKKKIIKNLLISSIITSSFISCLMEFYFVGEYLIFKLKFLSSKLQKKKFRTKYMKL